MKSDAVLKDEVTRELAWDVRLNVSVVVTVEQGVVTLTGSVTSDLAKIAAEDAARRIEGVLAIDNQLVVTGPDPDDTDPDAEQALRDDAGLFPA